MTHIPESHRPALAWVLAAVATCTWVLGVVLRLAAAPAFDAEVGRAAQAAFLLLALMGVVVLAHRPGDALGIVMTVSGGLIVLSETVDTYAYLAVVEADLPAGVWARWAQSWLYSLGWGAAGRPAHRAAAGRATARSALATARPNRCGGRPARRPRGGPDPGATGTTSRSPTPWAYAPSVSPWTSPARSPSDSSPSWR